MSQNKFLNVNPRPKLLNAQLPDPSSGEQKFTLLDIDHLERVLRTKGPLKLVGSSINMENSPSSPSLAPAYQRRNVSEPLYWFWLLDAVMLVTAFFISWITATYLNHHFFNRSLYKPGTYDAVIGVIQYIAISTGVLFTLERRGHYRMRMPFWQEARSILTTLGLAMIADGFLQFANKQDCSRVSLVLSWALAAFLMIVAHGILRICMRRRNVWQVRTLIVGAGTLVEDALAAIKSEPSLGYVVTAQINNLPAAFAQSEGSWETICEDYKADYVLIALNGEDLVKAEQPIAQLIREGIPFSIVPPLRHMPVFGMVQHYFFNHDVMLLTHNRGLEQRLPRLMKRGFDIISAGLALAFLSPIMLIVAFLVKSDGGPIFFGHNRIGYNGKIFQCLKFRTMAPDSDAILKRHLARDSEARTEWLHERKLRNDPRVTIFGKFLRSSSLDELPQLLNVLRGQMSLVGPRPIVREETEKYDDDIAYYYRVRPGITGLWQVSGRNNVSYGKRVQMDIWYVRNWSLWHDIAIICKTIPVILSRAGAY